MTDAAQPLIRPQLILDRKFYSDKDTIGQLNVDQDIFKCDTLEDTVRRVKVAGETAIPAGTYRLILSNHPVHGFVPELLNVPYYDGILIHAGNSDKDTKGCILVGRYDSSLTDWIGQSRTTHKALMDVLIPMNQKEKLYIEVRGGLTADQMEKSA